MTPETRAIELLSEWELPGIEEWGEFMREEIAAAIRDALREAEEEKALLREQVEASAALFRRTESRLRLCELSRKGAMEQKAVLQDTCRAAFNLIDGAECPIDSPEEWRRQVRRQLLEAIR